MKKETLVFVRNIILSLLAAVALFYVISLYFVVRMKTGAAEFIINAMPGKVSYRSIATTRDLRIIVHGFRLESSGTPVLTASRVTIAADIPGMISGKFKMRDIKFSEPVIYAKKGIRDIWNFQDQLTALTSCGASDIAALPARVQIDDGRIVSGDDRDGAELASALKGTASLSRNGQYMLDLSARAALSPFSIKGTVTPCVENPLDIEIVSSPFDFSSFVNYLKRGAGGPHFKGPIPLGGTGVLSLSIDGNPDHPEIEGNMSTNRIDASFSLTRGVLHFYNIKTGFAAETISGSGEIDLARNGMPAQFDLSTTGFTLDKLTASARTAPSGTVTGNIILKGSLLTTGLQIAGGSLTFKNPVVKFHLPSISSSANSRSVASLSLDSAALRITPSGDTTAFEITSIKGSGCTGAGKGSISPIPHTSSGEWNLTLFLNGCNLTRLLAGAGPFSEAVAGKASARVNVLATYGQSPALTATAAIDIRDGYLASPYSTPTSIQPSLYSKTDIIPFDKAHAEITIHNSSINIKTATATARWGTASATGAISTNGPIDLTATLALQPFAIPHFPSLSRFTGTAPSTPITAYSTITGTISSPHVTWRRADLQ